MEKLKKRNIPQEIIDEFMSMGPEAADQLEQFNEMTNKELKSYLDNYSQRQKTANAMAKKQYADERAAAKEARDLSLKDAKADYDSAVAKENTRYKKEMSKFAKDAEKHMREVGKSIKDGLKKGASMSKGEVKKITKSFTEDLVKQVKKDLGIKSPSTVFAGMAKNMADGIGVGFKDKMKDVGKTMQESIKDASGKLKLNIPDNFYGGIQDLISNIPGIDGSMTVNAAIAAAQKYTGSGQAYEAYSKVTSPQNRAGATFNQTVNNYSPVALSPAEAARQTRNATQQFILKAR